MSFHSESDHSRTKQPENSFHLLEVLRANKGFTRPERWINYARQYGFRQVGAEIVSCCPDCDSTELKKLGQYIYYSNLVSLHQCKNCRLVYANTRINEGTVSAHFDSTYVDEKYFLEKRRDIHRQIVGIISHYAPVGGKVIDIGGAKGHLMAALQQRRPDLKLVVNDVSRAKCEWARSHHQLVTMCTAASDVALSQEKYDVVTLIDVIYYEPNISRLWDGLDKITGDSGTLVLRVPNHYHQIIIGQWVWSIFATKAQQDMCVEIKCFNPEHLFVFSRKYLRRRLEKLGFMHVSFEPSALLIKNEKFRLIYWLYYRLAKVVHFVSSGKCICTPALVIVARR